MYMRGFFKSFWCLVMEKILFFILASAKTLTNFEDLYYNPHQNSCCGLQEAAYDSVNCSVR
jgi:hypothetical protein